MLVVERARNVLIKYIFPNTKWYRHLGICWPASKTGEMTIKSAWPYVRWKQIPIQPGPSRPCRYDSEVHCCGQEAIMLFYALSLLLPADATDDVDPLEMVLKC